MGPFGFLATKLCDALNDIHLGDDAIAEILMLTFMATGVCLWEGGRYVVKKGKENQWFDKFKNSAISLKTKITGKNK